jgi:hypothetical protein
MVRARLIVSFCFLLFGSMGSLMAFSQKGGTLESLFSEITLQVDTSLYTYSSHQVKIAGKPRLAFLYKQEDQVAELVLYPRNPDLFAANAVVLLPSEEFQIVDSMLFYANTYFKCRVRFKSISKTDLSAFHLVVQNKNTNGPINLELPIFPYSKTQALFYIGNDEIYVGEEKRFEIVTNALSNLVLDGVWRKQGEVEFRLVESQGQGFIDIVSLTTGQKELEVVFQTRKPFVDSLGTIQYGLSPFKVEFSAKGSRLSFLRLDPKEVIRSFDKNDPIEIQIDNHRNLVLNKTYRVENREERGGPLFAEIYTLRRLSNDKVLCVFRPYLYHRVTEGYLYIKEGDNPLFLTNINILPEAAIHQISILRNGKQWTSDLSIRPGEIIDIRLEGIGLENARFYFEDLEEISSDSMQRNDNVATFRLKVPLTIRKKSVGIFTNSKASGRFLQVVEHKKPRSLDFAFINYGEGDQMLSHLSQPIYYNHTVKDVILSFDEFKIDGIDQLYGKQILELEIRITGTRDELIEVQRLDYIEVCPAENSPRHAFYAGSTCNKTDISINTLLSRKTHSLDEWSKIEITVRHKKDAYGGEGYVQKVLIVMQKRYTFDVDLSFPAGLIIKRVGVDGFSPFGGVSLAMIAQFSFYQKNRIRRFKYYKIGAGFLAQNAFNFNPDNVDRDLGLVVIGSVYPARRESKFSFPLYTGFGYFLNDRRFFYLLGPGIRINF